MYTLYIMCWFCVSSLHAMSSFGVLPCCSCLVFGPHLQAQEASRRGAEVGGQISGKDREPETNCFGFGCLPTESRTQKKFSGGNDTDQRGESDRIDGAFGGSLKMCFYGCLKLLHQSIDSSFFLWQLMLFMCICQVDLLYRVWPSVALSKGLYPSWRGLLGAFPAIPNPQAI